MKKVVSIPEMNIEKFEKKMKELNKIAKKLDSGEVKFTHIADEIKKVKLGGQERYIKYRVYEIEGNAPTLNGWRLVATMERQGKLNLIKHINKDLPMPQGLERRENYCQHCKSNRRRKYLFVLQNENGEYIQVGKSCLKDFTGHKSPEQVAHWYSFIEGIEQYEEIPFGSDDWNLTFYYNALDVIAFSAYLTDKEGYIPVYAWTNENKNTVEKALKSIESNLYVKRKEVEEKGYFQIAEKVKDWFMSQPNTSEYIVNVKVLLEEGIVKDRKAGILASAYASYLKALDREKVKEERKQSQYVGEVGKRQNFELVFDRETSYETDFGTTYIYFFNDSDGNVLIWKTTKGVDFEKGQKVLIKATVKEHSEYRGVKQTVLTRCKVM